MCLAVQGWLRDKSCRVKVKANKLSNIWRGPCDIVNLAVSQVSHTATDGGDTTSAIHYRPPSIRRARPHGQELLDNLHAKQDYESFRQCLKTWLFSSY